MHKIRREFRKKIVHDGFRLHIRFLLLQTSNLKLSHLEYPADAGVPAPFLMIGTSVALFDVGVELSLIHI